MGFGKNWVMVDDNSGSWRRGGGLYDAVGDAVLGPLNAVRALGDPRPGVEGGWLEVEAMS